MFSPIIFSLFWPRKRGSEWYIESELKIRLTGKTSIQMPPDMLVKIDYPKIKEIVLQKANKERLTSCQFLYKERKKELPQMMC
jgi:hypothetical protein